MSSSTQDNACCSSEQAAELLTSNTSGVDNNHSSRSEKKATTTTRQKSSQQQQKRTTTPLVSGNTNPAATTDSGTSHSTALADFSATGSSSAAAISDCDRTAAPTTKAAQPKVATKMKSCKFFFSARGCAYGTSCKYSHELEHHAETTVSSDNSVTSERVGTAKIDSRPPCKFYLAGFCKWGTRCGFSHSERQQQKPQNFTKSHQQLDQKLSELSEPQLKTLRKTEITQLKKRFPKRVDIDSKTFRFVFRISDPDWPFDVKSINIQLVFPELYPKHLMSASIYDEGCLPSTLARHICKKMNDWLTDRLEVSLKDDKAELVFRPFLRWLDKTAERLFTDGLSMYKRELAAKAAGFTFISHADTKSSAEASDDSATTETVSGASGVEDTTLEMDEAFNSAMTLAEVPVESDTSAEPDNTTDAATAVHQTSNKLNPARRGTELRLKNLKLLESAATLHCTILRTGIRCARCKTVHHITMHPEKPYVVVCDKCRSKMSLIYHANLMHTNSSTVGFFDLDACQPFDLILQDCQLVAGCLECNREMLIHGLHADQEKQFWCTGCHKKMIISVEKGSYIVLNDGAAIKIGADAVLIAKKAKAKSDLKILAEGKQLPDKGACLHYKKSYRWFRFPCCGKLYPCDKCHDEKETDHEMELANRMVCGFCSKEQGFSLTKPCVSCDSSLTRSKSQHWEGGQGCRNKVFMAKGDKQKFAGSSKTVSKKAEAVQKKTGKKTTHIKHST